MFKGPDAEIILLTQGLTTEKREARGKQQVGEEEDGARARVLFAGFYRLREEVFFPREMK